MTWMCTTHAELKDDKKPLDGGSETRFKRKRDTKLERTGDGPREKKGYPTMALNSL